MVSANGLVYRSPKTERMLRSDPAEKPVAFQIFGADPDIMARAAVVVAAAGADIIDINFGCSVKKVLKTGSGSALMKDIERAEAILTAVRQAVTIPVTIKMRSGWDASGDDALRLTEIVEKCGLDGVALHPRTATQGFCGTADWALIKRLKQQTSLPVIGSGDVTSPEDALRMLDETGCDGVMIGRAAISSPWLLGQARQMWEGQPLCRVSLDMRFDFMQKYLRETVAHYGEPHGCRIMRSRLGWFSRALPHSVQFRESIKQIKTQAEAEQCLRDYKLFLLNRPGQHSRDG